MNSLKDLDLLKLDQPTEDMSYLPGYGATGSSVSEGLITQSLCLESPSWQRLDTIYLTYLRQTVPAYTDGSVGSLDYYTTRTYPLNLDEPVSVMAWF